MRAAALLGATLALGACVDHKGPITGTTSIKVEVTTPLGSRAQPLDVTMRNVVVNLTALDADGQPDTSFHNDLQVYVHYLATLTPYLDGTPLATVPMVGGKATNVSLMLPAVFGPTTLWFDDGKDAAPTFATGVSDPIWFRDPWIRDIQRPPSETALDALSNSPLNTKNIDVSTSAYGADGLLVVTSSFAQGYTVQDVSCPGGHPPCTSGPYDSLMVFSFSAPQFTDEHGQTLVAEGQVLSRFNGGVEEFNGLTEIGFPQTFGATPTRVDRALEPVPQKLEAGRAGETSNWFLPLSAAPDGLINFERNEAAPIEIDNAVVCQLDTDFATYSQWKIDPNGTPSAGGTSCTGNKKILNVITAGLPIDPATLVGKTLPRLVGVLRPVSIGSFNVWIVYPRALTDLTLP